MKYIFLTAVGLFLAVGVSKTKFSSSEDSQKSLLTGNEPAVEQARKLLRKVYPAGKVSGEDAPLDSEFAALIGNSVTVSRDQFKDYIGKKGINESEIGGRIDWLLSSVTDASGNSTQAKYFVIHDTSFPRFGDKDFPSNINDESWQFNNLERCWSSNVTHIFVSRTGKSKTINNFDVPITATKMERHILGETASRGLYLHVELIQPRKRDKKFWRGNDMTCPSPGFTDPQYQRLALLYMTASVRKGEWLIPAFHAGVDHGIRNSHDDPQGFELEQFMKAVKELLVDVSAVPKSNG
jgi:hypothetical protein